MAPPPRPDHRTSVMAARRGPRRVPSPPPGQTCAEIACERRGRPVEEARADGGERVRGRPRRSQCWHPGPAPGRRPLPLPPAVERRRAAVPRHDSGAGPAGQAQRQIESFDGRWTRSSGSGTSRSARWCRCCASALGLRWASLESVVKCEHKYWSRLEQRRVIDEYPRFGLVDLDDDPTLPDGLRYPVWLKPVKSASSALAYRVEDTATAPPGRSGHSRRHRTNGQPVRVRARPAASCRPS